MKPRRQARARTGHADDWLMTYADMITLLLCFFVVFLIVSHSKNEGTIAAPPERPAPAATATTALPPSPAPPRDGRPTERVSFPGLRPLPALANAEAPAAPARPTPLEPWDRRGETKTQRRDDATIVPPFPADDQVEARKSTGTPVPAAILIPIPVLVPVPTAAPAAPPPVAAAELPGDRITTIDMSSAAFFDSASATLSPGGRSILQNVAGDLKSERYKGYRITVEGHTDDAPISTGQFPSNWELSAARASAVVRFFLEQGIPAQSLRAAGYADTFPKAPNRDAAGAPIPDNQALNRRVTIKLEKIEDARPATGLRRAPQAG